MFLNQFFILWLVFFWNWFIGLVFSTSNTDSMQKATHIGDVQTSGIEDLAQIMRIPEKISGFYKWTLENIATLCSTFYFDGTPPLLNGLIFLDFWGRKQT